MKHEEIIAKQKELIDHLKAYYDAQNSPAVKLIHPQWENHFKRLESELQSLQEQEEKKEPDKDKKEMRDFILSEYEKGNIVFATVDGLCTVPIDEFLKQPEEGILYDLNRSEVVVLAFIDDLKWVNDYAMCKIVRKLLAKVEQLESLNQSGLRDESNKSSLDQKDYDHLLFLYLVKEMGYTAISANKIIKEFKSKER